MLTHVARRHGAQQRIGNRVRQNIGIRVPRKPQFVGDRDASQDQATPLRETVCIKSYTTSDHSRQTISHSPHTDKPFWRDSPPSLLYDFPRMRSSAVITPSTICLLAGCILWPGCSPVAESPESRPSPTPQAIVSLAPSITETLFALGLGDRVVGVTRYCTYPPEARTRQAIGGFEDVSYESIAALQPDLIVLLDAHSAARRNVEDLGWRVLEVKHERVDDILASMETLAELCDVAEAGETLVSGIRERMQAIAGRTAGRGRPRVLLTLGGSLVAADLSELYIAGKGGFYDSMITLAGGRNAYTGSLIFPAISTEGILQMNPDIIIDLVADLSEVDGGEAAAIDRWRVLPELPAVENGRVHIVSGNYVMIPGPRFIRTLEAIAAVVHPDAEDGADE